MEHSFIANEEALHTALSWYVVHTKPRQEDRAEAGLASLGIEAINPKRRLTASPSPGHGKSPHTALFPRYIFARFPIPQMLAKVRWTRGVQNVVAFGGLPTPVDAETIHFIRSRLGPDGMAKVETVTLVKGDEIKITGGPFKELAGIFQQTMSDEERVMLLLSHTQLNARVIVDRGSTEMGARLVH